MKKILLPLCFVFSLYGLSWANNFGSSMKGQLASVTFTHSAACDSAWIWFGYPDTTNFYDSLKLTAAFSGDATILIGDSLGLDSIGTHIVKIAYMLGGDDDVDGYVAGIWEQKPDTTAYQGAAAGLTASGVVDEFENRGYGFGSGTFACTVYAKLQSDSSAIPGIHVIAKNTAQDQLLGHCWTNANGWCALGLDSIAGGAYNKFWLINIDYSFSFPESADVNIDTSVVFYGSVFDYGDPPPDSQCAVYDQVFNPLLDSLNGVIISAKVYVPGDSALSYKGFTISPFTVSDTTDVSGRWRLDLIPNDMFKPDNPETTAYIFNFRYPARWGGYSPPQDRDTVRIFRSHLPSVTYGELRGR